MVTILMPGVGVGRILVNVRVLWTSLTSAVPATLFRNSKLAAHVDYLVSFTFLYSTKQRSKLLSSKE